MAARPGGPRAPDPSYAAQGDPRNPYGLQQQYNDGQQRYYESESDMGDPYPDRRTYASDTNGSNSALGEHQYYDQPGGYDYCELFFFLWRSWKEASFDAARLYLRAWRCFPRLPCRNFATAVMLSFSHSEDGRVLPLAVSSRCFHRAPLIARLRMCGRARYRHRCRSRPSLGGEYPQIRMHRFCPILPRFSCFSHYGLC